MALNDNATLVIGSGNYLTAPVGTDLPEDLLVPTSPWSVVGHTSLEDIFSIASEGGEATVIGSLQNKSLRTKYSARTETMTFTLQQFDIAGLKLYYGANAPVLPNGLVGVPTDPTPTVASFLVVFVDGENHFAFYAPKAEIYRADDVSFGDTESLAGLPIGVKPMAYQSNTWTYAITPLGASVATGATAGAPGSFTPEGSIVPANLAAMASVIATPTTAWTTGQHVVLGDASHTYWDGDSWNTGDAA
ncbi:major tail protein [Streptomyces phage Tefunt]|uniref:Major tail protein n=1 Tax=Streptomyces phage Tefunt TaxID=2041209 RepID=A0A291LIK2_9CAUD|nr:major tail protein [Streptomyces phage Tefunt]ATI18955.1 major tail protein [Streptomyces phage Tefunt]AXH70219.1 major tail protein [Streptomyces phage Haizum]QAY15756.1 major tail protein [Streptomyces phage Nishikigoi]